MPHFYDGKTNYRIPEHQPYDRIRYRIDTKIELKLFEQEVIELQKELYRKGDDDNERVR
jgi:hypothetical protein